MKAKAIILITFLSSVFCLRAQLVKVTGIVYDSLSMQPVSGASIIMRTGEMDMADESGKFSFQTIQVSGQHLTVSAIGYKSKTILVENCLQEGIIKLFPIKVILKDVVITGFSKSPYNILGDADIQMRGVANSQEILRMVPGLFIGQHQGGGKAEQIFLRGFDEDHGKDIKITMDGIPVNMVSHAHSHGYADSHFIIPETLNRVVFNKGPYDSEKGDQATSGYLDFITTNTLAHNTIKTEVGQFSTYRVLAMINLLHDKLRAPGNSWYAASEFNYSNSFFELPQHFSRFNFFTKLNYQLSTNNQLTVSASTFYSSWLASGQIPERAVAAGIVDYYGALDPDEGGKSSRSNVNIVWRSVLRNGEVFKNQFYYSRYRFDLNSNFTFYLNDSLNGDEIRQRECRNLFGYNGSYLHRGSIGKWKTTSQLGIDLRLDAVTNAELSHTKERYILLNREKLGDINELGLGLYTDLSIHLNEKWRVRAGLRFDHFKYRYHNKFAGDTVFADTGNFKARNQIVSPKINIYYNASPTVQLYLSLGKGFHTNDARVVVADNSNTTLPAAYGIDIGSIYKPLNHLLIHTVIWYIYLQQESVYAGDGGTIDFSGPTKRIGFDISMRYQPLTAVLLDFDLNFAHGRSTSEVKGYNFIPLAPIWSSTAGIKLMFKTGWNASLRYRYLSKRPANQDYSLACSSYFINDLVINHKNSRFEYGLVINNLFNIKWKETQFETLTRLRHESTGINDITFTAGAKFSAKISFSYFFDFIHVQKTK